MGCWPWRRAWLHIRLDPGYTGLSIGGKGEKQKECRREHNEEPNQKLDRATLPVLLGVCPVEADKRCPATEEPLGVEKADLEVGGNKREAAVKPDGDYP